MQVRRRLFALPDSASKSDGYSRMIFTKMPSGSVADPRMWMTPSRVKPRSMVSALGDASVGGVGRTSGFEFGREMMGWATLGEARDLGSGGVVALLG